MTGDGTPTRYTAEQLADGIARARGDSRWFLVTALIQLRGPATEAALRRVLAMDLRPGDRYMVMRALAETRPAEHLRPFVLEWLRSSSIGHQQMAIAQLATMGDPVVAAGLADEVAGWLTRRLKNPRREHTWALWEVPDAALALIPSYGPRKVREVVDELAPRMQPEEHDRWSTVKRASADEDGFILALRRWSEDPEVKGVSHHDETYDPTADAEVDRAMRRLHISPANPAKDTWKLVEGIVETKIGDLTITTSVVPPRSDADPGTPPPADRRP